MTSMGREQLLEVVEPRIPAESLKDLRIGIFLNLQAYWQAFYEAVYIGHPNYTLLISTLMSQNPQNKKTHIQGPLPVFFAPTPETQKQMEVPDYRALNDHRVAIIDINQGVVNENSLAILLGLDEKQLRELDSGLRTRMEQLTQLTEGDPLLEGCRQEIEKNPAWKKDQYLEFNPITLRSALQELGVKYLEIQKRYNLTT